MDTCARKFSDVARDADERVFLLSAWGDALECAVVKVMLSGGTVLTTLIGCILGAEGEYVR